eukprot:COSAG01_NODE_10160_length_2233_cov_3.019681_1_plen_104_part_10
MAAGWIKHQRWRQLHEAYAPPPLAIGTPLTDREVSYPAIDDPALASSAALDSQSRCTAGAFDLAFAADVFSGAGHRQPPQSAPPPWSSGSPAHPAAAAAPPPPP